MLLSIGLILLAGMLAGWLCKKIKLPSLIGMILVGILIGPFAFNLIDESILNISSQIRRIALIVILIRAGLSLDLNSLKKVGRPAVLLCFLPAVFEIAGMILLAPRFLPDISIMEAAVMGCVVAAVSPAVIVPRMIKLIEEGYGKEKSIPEMILAGASVDDVFVIVMFYTALSLLTGGEVKAIHFINIPVSIILGIAVGIGVGLVLGLVFSKLKINPVIQTIILLCISFLLSEAEEAIPISITFSALIAIMFQGIAIRKKNQEVATVLSGKFNQIWVVAEVFLFVLVGACVNYKYAINAGIPAVLLLLSVLVFRMLGVFLCLLGTGLSVKEKLFCMISYIPKATVQAAIGSIPLAMNLPCGDMVLTVAVLAILITAPLGAFGIDITYKKILKKSNN